MFLIANFNENISPYFFNDSRSQLKSSDIAADTSHILFGCYFKSNKTLLLSNYLNMYTFFIINPLLSFVIK